MSRLVMMRLLESYFRHRWLHVLPIGLMLAAGLVYAFLKPLEYISRGVVYVPGEPYLVTLTDVRTSEGQWWVSPAQGAANEISDLLRTEAFVRTILARTSLAGELKGIPQVDQEIIEETREAIWATTDGNNQIVVQAVHESPLVAQQLAVATIDSYTQWRIDQELAASGAAQVFFDELISSYRADVDAARAALSAYLEAHPEPVLQDRPDVVQIEIDRLTAEVTAAQDRYATALTKEENARLAASQAEVSVRQAFYVVDSPQIPHESELSLRRTALEQAIFVGVGGLLTLLAVVGGAVLDRTLLFPQDVHEALHLPVLAVISDPATQRRRKPWRRPGPQPELQGAGPAGAEPISGRPKPKKGIRVADDQVPVTVFVTGPEPTLERDAGA
jgi:uncharacterized protein involved in exopolysaccharide biosynthesis